MTPLSPFHFSALQLPEQSTWSTALRPIFLELHTILLLELEGPLKTFCKESHTILKVMTDRCMKTKRCCFYTGIFTEFFMFKHGFHFYWYITKLYKQLFTLEARFFFNTFYHKKYTIPPEILLRVSLFLFLTINLTININSCSKLHHRKKWNIGNGCNQYIRCYHELRSVLHTHRLTKAHVRGPVMRRCGISPMPTSRMLWMLIPPDLFDPLSPQLLSVRHFQHRAASWVGMSLKGHGEEFTARLLGRPGLFQVTNHSHSSSARAPHSWEAFYICAETKTVPLAGPTWASSPWSAPGSGSPGSGSPLCTGDSWEGESGGLMTTDLSERLLSLLLLAALWRSRLRSLEAVEDTKGNRQTWFGGKYDGEFNRDFRKFSNRL